jgi:hypothetical protein
MSYTNRYSAHALSALYPNVAWQMEEDDLDQITWKDGEPEGFDKDAVLAKALEIEAGKPMEYLRVKRDQLIAKTDWWVLPDRTPTQEQLDYRQALRDLPANTEDPENPVWPVKP